MNIQHIISCVIQTDSIRTRRLNCPPTGVKIGNANDLTFRTMIFRNSPMSIRWKLNSENVGVGPGELTTKRISGMDRVLFCGNSDYNCSFRHTVICKGLTSSRPLHRVVMVWYMVKGLCL